jgi:signal transduction histidine kinase
VRLQVDVDRPLPAEVEATCYFVVSEALTNAARHAQAGVIDVAVSLGLSGLAVEVRDDGVGGATVDGGSGLQGLVDRVSALGARLELESPPGGGTTLRTVLPCG